MRPHPGARQVAESVMRPRGATATISWPASHRPATSTLARFRAKAPPVAGTECPRPGAASSCAERRAPAPSPSGHVVDHERGDHRHPCRLRRGRHLRPRGHRFGRCSGRPEVPPAPALRRRLRSSTGGDGGRLDLASRGADRALVALCSRSRRHMERLPARTTDPGQHRSARVRESRFEGPPSPRRAPRAATGTLGRRAPCVFPGQSAARASSPRATGTP